MIPATPRLITTILVAIVAAAAVAEPIRLPTGARLDPASTASPVGNFPLAAALSPDGKYLALLLCGWREQGVQIVERNSGNVVQTLPQAAAFVGIAFSPDGKALVASGGNEDALYVYDWHDGTAALKRRIPLGTDASRGARYPAGLTFSPDGTRLYVAENLGDALDVIDVARGAVLQRVQTDRYPYAVAVSRNNDVYVSSWGDNTVMRFRTHADNLRRDRRIVTVRHPSAMLLDDAHARLYVASASTDRVAVIDTRTSRTIATLEDNPPGTAEGSTPNALALARDGRLFVAEADNNAVAVFRGSTLLGRIPTEWYPSALAIAGDELCVVNAKGGGTAPNRSNAQPGEKRPATSHDYTLGQLRGSVMRVPISWTRARLATFTKRVVEANGWNTKAGDAKYPPFRHVIYVIKENRTYDQLFGDIAAADGDPSLVFFGRDITPNHHALAERFGVFDRFFTNAEVSTDGHNWSTAAYATDYVEKTTPSNYSSRGRTYDYEGSNRNVIVDEDDDVAAPAAGYLWNLALRKHITFRDYGEFVVPAKHPDDIQSSAFFPTRRALRDVFCPEYPGWDLSIPDQKRADVWLAEFRGFVERQSMPALQIIRLPNDHTAGGSAGMATPRAYVADNDLALARIIEALTHSRFWRDTVVFVVEDDAQSGPDHVDSHRSVLLVISAWNRSGVDHRFVNTTDVLATIEQILGLDSLSQFDRYGRPLRDWFGQQADPRPYDAIVPAVDLNEKNPSGTEAAKQSALLDFSRADVANEEQFNGILWRMIKHDAVPPGVTRQPAGSLQP